MIIAAKYLLRVFYINLTYLILVLTQLMGFQKLVLQTDRMEPFSLDCPIIFSAGEIPAMLKTLARWQKHLFDSVLKI